MEKSAKEKLVRMVTPEFKVFGEEKIARIRSLRTWTHGTKDRKEWEVGLLGRELDELAFAIIRFDRPEPGTKWIFHDGFEVLASAEQVINIVRLQVKARGLPDFGFLTQIPSNVVAIIAEEIKRAVNVDIQLQPASRDVYDIIYTTMNLLWRRLRLT